MRSSSSLRALGSLRRLLGAALLLLPVATGACASPDAGDDGIDDADVRFDNLEADEAEIRAAQFLAKHDALGTDFETYEGEVAAREDALPEIATANVSIASVTDDMKRLEQSRGNWSYALSVVSATGEVKKLAEVETKRPMLGASTFKLFTGWTALANGSAGNATLTTMLRMSDNGLANLVMCRNGEVLGRWDVKCVARDTPPASMRVPDAIRQSNRWLEANGVDLGDAFAMKDGAGLVEDGTLAIDDLMRLLLRVHRDPRADKFRNMLAQPGVSSTLRSRFRGYNGKLYAKTGTYNDWGGGVKALAGYVKLSRNRTLVFAIVGNQVGNASRAMDAIESSLTDAIKHADAAR